MNKIYIIIISILMPFILLSQEKVSYKHPNGTIKEEGFLIKDKKHGVWREWDDRGLRVNEIEYDQGVKLYVKNYYDGYLLSEIDNTIHTKFAFVKNYHTNGVAWGEEFIAKRYIVSGAPNTSIDKAFAYKIFRHRNGTLKYYTYTIYVDEKDLHRKRINLPTYRFFENGQFETMGFGSNYLNWHEDSTLARAEGYFDQPNKKYSYRWNRKGEQVDNRLRNIQNDTLESIFELAENKLVYQLKNDLPHGKWVNYYPNGQLWYQQEFNEGIPVGKFIAYHFNGKKHVEGELINGFFHRKYTQWYVNGRKKFEGELNLGCKDGNWRFWSKYGVLMKEENYSKLKLNGPYRVWNYKGILVLDKHYIMGKQTGVSREWYSNGILKREIFLQEAKLIGSNKEFYRNGRLEKIYNQGIGLKIEYFSNGAFRRVRYIGHGNGSTLSINWNSDGDISSMGYGWNKKKYVRVKYKGKGTESQRNIVNANEIGHLTYELKYSDEHYKNKEIESQRYIVNGIEIKQLPFEFLYRPAKNLFIQEGDSQNGKREGLWITNYPNGKKWIYENYKNGVLDGKLMVFGRLKDN